MRPSMLICLFFLMAGAPQGGCHLSFPDQARLAPQHLVASVPDFLDIPGMGGLLLT